MFRVVIMLIISLIIAFILSVIIHELGHLLFGLLGKYLCKGITIFHISLIKKDNKLRITHDTSDDSTVFGQCIMYPADEACTNPSLCSMGGIYINLLVGLLFMLPAILHPNIKTLIFCLTMSLTNFALAVISLWFGGVTSDGVTSRQLKDIKEKSLYNKILTVGKNATDGIPFGQMKFDLNFTHNYKSSMSAEYSLYRYYSYLENIDICNVLKNMKTLEAYDRQAGIVQDAAIERAILETLMDKKVGERTKMCICGSTGYIDYLNYLQQHAKKNARICLLHSLTIGRLNDAVKQNTEKATYQGCWISVYNTFMKRTEIAKKLSEAR